MPDCGHASEYPIAIRSKSIYPPAALKRIICRFGMHPVVIAFLFVWFGVFLLIGGNGIIAGVTELISGSGPEASESRRFIHSGDDANVRRRDSAGGPLSCCG
jgi:hypothetical protein